MDCDGGGATVSVEARRDMRRLECEAPFWGIRALWVAGV